MTPTRGNRDDHRQVSDIDMEVKQQQVTPAA